MTDEPLQARLCVTVTGATTAELRARRDQVPDADLIELRLDSVRDPNVAGALADRRRPVIVTCRPTWEGGRFTGSEDERRTILADAIALGAEYVDVEWRAGFDDLIRSVGGRGIVVSTHDFDAVPGDLADRVRAMRATGAEFVKVAATLQKLSDSVPLLNLAARDGRGGKLIVTGMGDYGGPTRILASRIGSAWTYAGALRDIGQLDASRLLHDYRFRSVTSATDIYGIVGGSVAHSVSPSIHNAAFRATNIDAVYVPFPSVDADDFVAFGRAIGIKGASVTIPHKVTMFDRVDEDYAVARRIGAINTIKVENNRWIGGNTDAYGFLYPLRQVPLTGVRVSLLGAGGAARAVADALASAGCTLCIHARDRAKAHAIAALVSAEVGPWPPADGSWDLLVNATPLGMYPRVDETPIARAHLTGKIVYDLVYNPPTTRLLRDASDMGCQTIGGLDMLVAQATEQFQWWTGEKAPAGVMRDAALKRLAEFARDEDYVV